MTVALSDSEILSIWEAGRRATTVERGLLLLRPIVEGQEAESWTVAERDAYLFASYAATFGTQIDGVTTCPECGEQLDVMFPVAGIIGQPEAYADRIEVTTGDPAYRVAVRLPCIADLRAIIGLADLQIARRALAEACIASIERDGASIAPESVTDSLIDRIEETMAAHDRQSDVGLSMVCPSCAHGWRVTFDIADFLWRTLEDRAKRLVVDVHLLARAYGWSEKEILSMSQARRELYQELVW